LKNKSKQKNKYAKWKKRTIREKLKRINLGIKIIDKEIKTFKSPKSNPASQQQTSGWNKSVRGFLQEKQKSWRVLRETLIFPLLGDFFAKDFSSLKSILITGDWKRVIKGSSYTWDRNDIERR